MDSFDVQLSRKPNLNITTLGQTFNMGLGFREIEFKRETKSRITNFEREIIGRRKIGTWNND